MEFLYSPTSPFSRKVLVVAHELGITGSFRLVSVNPRKDVEPVARSNPLGKIPVLTTEGGIALYDSRVICAWLDETYGDKRLHPEGARKWQTLREIALADGILDAASQVRQERLRPPETRSKIAIAAEIARVHRALDEAEASASLFDAPLAMGQLSLACAVDWLKFRLPDEGWEEGRPRVARAISSLLSRDSLKRTDPRL